MSERRSVLRRRLFASAIAVAVAPFVFLISMSRWEIWQVTRTEAADTESAIDLVTQLEASGLEAARTTATQLAQSRKQRIRLIRDGALVFDVDGSLADSTAGHWTEQLYGPVRPGLESLDAEVGDVPSQSELSRGGSERFSPGGNVLTHSVARYVPSLQVWVHVRGYSRRAVLPEVARARQLAKLASISIAVALAVAWLAARRFLGPIEQLRTQVLESATTAVPRAEIDLGRRDELGDLADAFNTVLEALAQRTRTNEAFLTDLAHEMKNPIATVRACSELLAQGGVSAERAAKLTSALERSSLQLDRLVTQFLELARAEAGLPAEARESVPLGALLRGLESRFRADPRFASVTWKTDGLEATVSVTGVATRLERAFGNLILNALTFAGDGGWVELQLAVHDAEVEVTVRDSGPGLEADQIPRLFERFFTTRQERKGTGLGLALTRAILEAHGGRIAAESPPGGGARFTVRLPHT